LKSKPDVLGDIVDDLQLVVEKPSKETEIEKETQRSRKKPKKQPCIKQQPTPQ
jgi:hypothetical protein